MRKLLLPMAFLMLAACGENRFFYSSPFAIPVDSIQAPEVISANQAFTVRFYATVGDSDCFSFEGFDRRDETTQGLSVWVVGRYTTTGECRPAEVMLEGEPLELVPPFEDPFTLTVLQPVGNPLVRVIPVQ